MSVVQGWSLPTSFGGSLISGDDSHVTKSVLDAGLGAGFEYWIEKMQRRGFYYDRQSSRQVREEWAERGRVLVCQ
jgi:hypothetical protein